MRTSARLLVVVSTLFVPILLSGQTTSKQLGPANDTGIQPYGAYAGARENINLTNGNVNIEIPLVSLPGRNGHGFTLTLQYDSKNWVLHDLGVSNPNVRTIYLEWDTEVRYPQGPAMGWRYNVPYITGGDQVYDEGTGLLRYADYVVTLIDGSKHVIASPYNNTPMVPIDSEDTSFLRLEVLSDNQQVVTSKDGTKIYFPSAGYDRLASKIVDSDGNLITFQVSSNVVLNGVTDSSGNTITVGSGSVTYIDSNGIQQTITYAAAPTRTWNNVTFNPHTTSSNFIVYGPYNSTLTYGGLGSITLPGNLVYSFNYETAWGELTRITYPTGGYTDFAYATYSALDTATGGRAQVADFREISSRTVCSQVSGGSCTSSSLTTYTPTITITNVNNSAMQVNEPENRTVYYQFTQAGSNTYARFQVPQETQRIIRNGGTAVKTIVTDHDPAGIPSLPTAITTTLNDSGQVMKETFAYDTHTVNVMGPPDYTIFYQTLQTVSRPIDNPTQHVVYDFGAGAPGAALRKTVSTWSHGYDATPHILTLKTHETVYGYPNGTETRVSEKWYDYDTIAPANVSSATQHDSAYGTGYTTRGKVNVIRRIRNTQDGITFQDATLSTTLRYDILGNLTQITDPKGHNTYYGYSDSWGNTTCVPASGANAFLTSITNAKYQITGMYNSCTGTVSSISDQNNQTSNFTYDVLGRLTEKLSPDQGNGRPQVDLSYTATTLTTTTKITGSISSVIVQTLDGVGRLKNSCVTSDPDGAVCTDTDYDGLDRKKTVSNPHRSQASDTDGTTAYKYDVLNRVTKQIPADGSETSNNIATDYYGNRTTVTDQASKQRRSWVNALGWLTQVDEPGGTLGSRSLSTPWTTLYSYNGLGLPTRVDQKGGDSNSANWRTRTAVYNTLGQLLTSNNPETGAIDYRYDDDGNVSSRTQPAPNQTNSNTKVTITYSYDEIERMTGKSDGTVSTTYSFDASGSGNYGVGRRTGMIDPSGSTNWTYDQNGNVKTVAKTIGTVAKTFSYAYNLDASVATITYPTGTVLTYTPNQAGQVITVTDAANYKYVSEVHYWPTGALNTGLLGKTGSFAGISLLDSYNPRLQPKRISATTPTLSLIDLNYDFNQGTVQAPVNNGTLKAITNALDAIWSRAFTYDELNRVVTAQTPNSANYGASFNIDPWGNLLGKSAITGKNVVWALTEQVNGKNQFTDMDYDAAGNLMNDRIGHTYAYDSENRISSTGGVTYTYDGDGQRVKKSNGTLYWTGTGSATLLETALDGTATAEYVFFNAKRIARIDRPSGAVHFYLSDHLASTTKVTNVTGTSVEEQNEFGAYGEPLLGGTGKYLFNGKERDGGGEDNFGARYFAFRTGRFLIPDWSGSPQLVPFAKLDSPQSLNLYAYVQNNPITGTDPDGHLAVYQYNYLGSWACSLNGGCSTNRQLWDKFKRAVYFRVGIEVKKEKELKLTKEVKVHASVEIKIEANYGSDKADFKFGGGIGGEANGKKFEFGRSLKTDVDKNRNFGKVEIEGPSLSGEKNQVKVTGSSDEVGVSLGPFEGGIKKSSASEFFNAVKDKFGDVIQAFWPFPDILDKK